MEHQEYEFTLGLVNDDTNELFLHFSARVTELVPLMDLLMQLNEEAHWLGPKWSEDEFVSMLQLYEALEPCQWDGKRIYMRGTARIAKTFKLVNPDVQMHITLPEVHLLRKILREGIHVIERLQAQCVMGIVQRVTKDLPYYKTLQGALEKAYQIAVDATVGNPKDDSADERLRARYARAVMKQRRR